MLATLLLSGNIAYLWYFLLLVGGVPMALIVVAGWWYYVRKAAGHDERIGRLSLVLLLAFIVGAGACFSMLAFMH
ncbi:hypothetical protein [Hymenobacter setariae]|uniref:hypothetical protein n=1 Tax=Hymenobacter setariae TaxID=2594794 RepID=UPI0011A22993|nr:hypothetical protein [Hymenobacter setariae]